MGLNSRGIRCRDIAADLVPCFTEYQKSILEYKQGEISITIADQINFYYGENYLTYDKDTTIKQFAIILYDHA